MQEQINQLKIEIENLKKMINDLDFAIKNHKHKDTDFSQKLS